MTWHAVDNQSTHAEPIYHGGLKVLLEVPNAPDWEYTRAADTPEYVKPKALDSLNETVEKIGTAKLKERCEELRDKLQTLILDSFSTLKNCKE